jgi:U3 small nucleolar RNA-associated protein 22
MQEVEKKMDDPDAPSMCIWTPYDSAGDVWTQRGPGAVVLKRTQVLASRGAERLKAILQGRNGMDASATKNDANAIRLGDDAAWESLFTPALTHYDIVLKLRRASLPFPDHALFTAKQIKRRLIKELGVDADGLLEAEHGNKRGLQLAKMPEKVLARGPDKARAAMLVGFDPLRCFLREAERRLGGTALLFADEHGGDLIGVALKPSMQHHGAELPASLGDFDPLGDFSAPAAPSVDQIAEELLFCGVGFVIDAYKGAKWA